MKNLIGKYRSARMTGDELRISREKANTMSDSELSESIFADWQTFSPDQRLMDTELETRIYRRISANWLHRNSPVAAVWRWVRLVAVIAVPVLLFSTVYFYRASTHVTKAMTCVSTGNQEKASVRMPDGSDIELNGNSAVEYDLTSFTDTSRKIKFSGEGYFNVAKAADKPFVIDAYGLEVTVKGTSFVLQAYESGDYASLFLLDGVVALRSKKTQEQVELHANDKAVINQATGQIAVSQIDYNDNPVGWKENKLFFRNAELLSVIRQLEQHFACHIIMDEAMGSERFSGLVPVDNIDEALSVIEKAFNIDLTVAK